MKEKIKTENLTEEEVNKTIKSDDILNIVKVFISHIENTKEKRNVE